MGECMNEYYVEKIEYGNSIHMDVRWGVFRREHSDTEILNKPKGNLNLIVWTYEKLSAEKIAEVLNIDEYNYEKNLEIK